ncbi:Rv1733c family protein [Prauserella flavalba]|uniref:Rv1733c family protein n=1 Tax=Prauserella flavalba TaxID=1477506 RepID=UPI00143CCB34|nr:hypothetical protein [Prauserella flavalba]
METVERVSWTERLLRRIWPGRSPLARGWDRLEGGVLFLAILTPLVVLPFAAAAGSETYASDERAAAVQARERHRAEATLVADAPPAPLSAHGGASRDETAVKAEWLLPDGTRRTGTVRAEAGSPTGSAVHVWLDQRGNLTRPPLTATTAVWDGIAVAVSLWLGTVVACAGGYWLVRRAIDRRRFAQWEREWADIDPQPRR